MGARVVHLNAFPTVIDPSALSTGGASVSPLISLSSISTGAPFVRMGNPSADVASTATGVPSVHPFTGKATSFSSAGPCVKRKVCSWNVQHLYKLINLVLSLNLISANAIRKKATLQQIKKIYYRVTCVQRKVFITDFRKTYMFYSKKSQSFLRVVFFMCR